jgi:hypothetical protein
MYKYWGFGLRILSEIEFPELLPNEFTEPDVTINLGKTPEKLEGDDVIKKPFSSISKNEYILNVKNICKYYSDHGNRIIAEPAPGIDVRTVRLFLLGTVMAATLYQRGNIPVHSSAIVKNGRLILFTGDSGAGKSTLLAHLATKGYEVFTDDICVVQSSSADKNCLVGAASYPMIKLWEDAISKLDNDQFTKDFKIRPELPKYGQFFYDTFNLQWIPIEKIFILHPLAHSSEITVKKLPAMQAFRKLEKQAYKFRLMTNQELRTLHFSLLSIICNNIPVYEVNRPTKGTTIELLSATIEKIL